MALGEPADGLDYVGLWTDDIFREARERWFQVMQRVVCRSRDRPWRRCLPVRDAQQRPPERSLQRRAEATYASYQRGRGTWAGGF